MMTIYAFLFMLSAIGISETVYLIRKRKAQESPVCFLGEDCQKVLESKYNKIFLIHNDILGLIFYLLLSFIIAFLAVEAGPQELLNILLKVAIFSGAGAHIFFIYLQLRVIKAWCLWCLMSAATTFLMAIIVLFV